MAECVGLFSIVYCAVGICPPVFPRQVVQQVEFSLSLCTCELVFDAVNKVKILGKNSNCKELKGET